ncbi:EAL domain-containing protein [Ochrobactrum chromiisoli]|uniref:cyclic-guanylate-specific phosphodiesterase n=1 Tax=Ochrobactrum chromiisoli TaxID=2993941 RepID=A0ABT3QJY8_9HYPH|nr:EAL domain-containing protein [Ochrobactrum chromiisoli]MCX2695928.1 EAL domain-containing protein [Ochrobactrum chromiisoli]
MRFPRSSFLSPVPFVICIMLLLGAFAGKWAGERFSLLDEEGDMNTYMTVLMTQANRIVGSARDVLDKMNRSTNPICGADDKQYMRELLFSGYHIKDIGRLENEKLQCSTLLNELKDSRPRSKEDVLLKDHTYIYRDEQLITPGSHGPIIGRDKANVVLSAVAFDALHIPQYHFAVFMVNEDRTQFARLFSNPIDFPGDVVSGLFPVSGGRVFEITDGILQQKSCDETTGICIFIATSPGWSGNSGGLLKLVFISLGMLVGGGLAIGWSNYRNRDRSLMSLLRKALAAKQLTLVYQPVVNISSRKIVGFEALIRWEITKDDFVPPDLFIAKAEAHGIADKVTLYVLDRVILEMGGLLKKQRALHININITASDLQSVEFMKAIDERLTTADIRPEQIGLELTERTPVDFAKASEGIKLLRERGHKVYIDDFGTGYSSLAYLDELKVDAIKIDKAFTRTVGNEVDTVSIVPQIISMAHQHGLGIVVEGVETESQAEYFRGICSELFGQGWFFGKPVDAAAVQVLVGNVSSVKKRGRPKSASGS